MRRSVESGLLTVEKGSAVYERKDFDQPDDRMEFPHGRADVLDMGGTRVQRVTFEPGFV
jgi:hypothetical protein